MLNIFSHQGKAEIDVFLELSCLFNDPMDVGNLISGSSAFHTDKVYFIVLMGPKFLLEWDEGKIREDKIGTIV